MVLGSSGRLGRELCHVLKGHGHHVLPHSTTGPHEFRANVLVQGSIRNLIARHRPSIIINTIALTDVDRCELEPELSDRVNVGPTREIREYVREGNELRILHISTDHLYGNEGPHTEMNVHILNQYASDKYRAEEQILEANGVAFRTNFFGRSLDAKRPSYSDWLVSAARSGQEFHISDKIQFNPLRIRTLSDLVCKFMASGSCGIYNVGASSSMTKFEFATRFLSTVGESLEQLRVLAPAEKPFVPRPIDMRMDVSRIESALLIKMPSLIDEIEDEAEVYRNE